MKKALVIGVILFMGLIVSAAIFDGETQNQATANITFNEVQSDLSSGATLIDVRTPEEFADGYIAGAINLSLGSIQAGLFPDVDKTTKVYVYCRSGNRSAEAKQLLSKAGFSNVVDLGGIEEVVAIGGQKIR
jgi:rhodanese-related sulfurtransferase